MPVLSTTQSIQNVTYPALSNIGGDERKFAESYRQIVMMTAFAMFPVMAGLTAVADDMFALLLGEKWMPTVPYFRVLCLTGLFAPLASVALNVMKVRSDGRIIVRAEVVKKMFMTVVLAVTIPTGVMAVAWGLVASSAVDFAVNAFAARRCSRLGWGSLLRTLLPIAVVTAAMYGAITGILLSIPAAGVCLRLAAGIATGAVVYGCMSLLLCSDAVAEARSIVRRLFC